MESIDKPSFTTHRFDVPRIILHGGGSRHKAVDIVKELGCHRVLIVTDPGVLALGMVESIHQSLEQAGIAVATFSDVQPDPTDRNVEDGHQAAMEHGSDCVIAIGGGSPMDAAKVIAVRGNNPQPLSEFMGLHRITSNDLPLIAIPPTAGTGSEATKVAVITDTEQNVKMMMLSAPLLPTAAVVDFELSMSMPPALTAAVGVDTLTHAIEAYVSRKANRLSDPLALQCVEICATHLRRAWSVPDDSTAREAMMLAATLGGMAFSNSSVCLVHGMSRPIGAVFHLPHGLSNAVLLPSVTRFSVGDAEARYATVARTTGCAEDSDDDATACEKLIAWLVDLNAELNLPRLSECPGVSREVFDQEVQKMASDALASGSPNNNPRIPSHDEVVQLYQDAF